MSEAGAAIARFAFTNGPQRGSHLTLYANCLVHRSRDELETLALATVSSVRVAFVHEPGRVLWGAAAIVAAAVLLGISAPLANVADAAAGDVAGNPSGVGVALHALFRFVGAAARVLPLLALASAAGGLALAVLGWLGATTFAIAFAGGERAYVVRGRNSVLIDFAETVSQKLMQLKR